MQLLKLNYWRKSFFRYTGRLSLAPLPCETQSPILLDPYHSFTKLIISNIHERNKHKGYKDTLTELWQRFWTVQGTELVRNLLWKCIICKEIERKSHAYASQTALCLREAHPSDTTSAYNFGPLLVVEVFMRKMMIKCTKHGLHLIRMSQRKQFYLI